MKLSTPIYQLKRQARQLSRKDNLPLHKALDKIAAAEGFPSWGLLAAKHSQTSPATRLLAALDPGDMVLLGARPGHGKTLLGLELLLKAIGTGRSGFLFSLECTPQEVATRLHDLGADLPHIHAHLQLDASDTICADHMIRELTDAAPGALVVVDYLQLLDQKRENPPLSEQISALRDFAKTTGMTFVFLSQIDRKFELSGRDFPQLHDIRLPNPLDLNLFDTLCFLNNGTAQLERVA